MSDSPEAKRVRRADLYTSPSAPRSTSPDPALPTKLQAQLDQLYRGVVNSGNGDDNGNNKTNDGGGTDGQGEGGFEFRLFSTLTRRRTSGELDVAARRVDLRSPTPVTTAPGFIQPRRPDTYYFANKISAEKREAYERAAVHGEDIRKGLRTRWPGSELPWRVLDITCNGVGMNTSDVERPHKKRKAGKKRRIVLRKREVLERTRREMEAKSKVEKEKAESDKRTRRNREKKVKRKEKEKAKKTSRVDDPA